MKFLNQEAKMEAFDRLKKEKDDEITETRRQIKEFRRK